MSNPQTEPATSRRPDPFAHPVTPHLVIDGAAEAIDFYAAAFGASELMRLPADGGRLMHGCVTIAGAPIMLMDSNPDWGALSPADLGGSPVTIHLTVPDVDAAFARAVEAGATAKMEPQDMFWGDRYGSVQDPFGHMWAFSTPGEALSMEEIAAGAAAQEVR